MTSCEAKRAELCFVFVHAGALTEYHVQIELSEEPIAGVSYRLLVYLSTDGTWGGQVASEFLDGILAVCTLISQLLIFFVIAIGADDTLHESTALPPEKHAHATYTPGQ